MEYLDGVEDGKPFFAYLAFTAPHDPLHVPDEWLDKYAGRYDAGYGALRAERLKRMQALGILPEGTRPSDWPAMLPEWDALGPEQQRREARRMELHAAMIENMDHHLGRLFAYLKERGLYDDTLILFLSDNGAAPTEFHNYPDTTREWVERNSDNRFENWGRRGSRIALGPAWALASNTPLRYFKGLHTGGGIRVPLIVSGPGVAGAGRVSATFAHVTDIAPTLLELAGVRHPSESPGSDLAPMQGRSLLPVLAEEAETVRADGEAIGWELFGRRAIRRGRWKAIWIDAPFGENDWQLFDVDSDPGECRDLAEAQPDVLFELVRAWQDYADHVGVVLPMAPQLIVD